MKIVGIVQARMGSTRLPLKMMLSLRGHAIIEWVLLRVSKAMKLDDIIAAIPSSRENDILADHIHSLGIDVFRGSEENVLNRFYSAAMTKNASHIVRICADNPLVAPEEIDHLIDYYIRHPCHYAYNHIPRGNRYPDGLGAEIISFELLEYLEQTVIETRHREHCFSFITDNAKDFVVKTFDPPDERIANPAIKLDIDTFDDYYNLSRKDITIESTPFEIISLFRKDQCD